MRNSKVATIDDDDVLAPHYLPAELTHKFAAAQRQRRQHWIWTLVVSTALTTLGLVIWLASKL